MTEGDQYEEVPLLTVAVAAIARRVRLRGALEAAVDGVWVTLLLAAIAIIFSPQAVSPVAVIIATALVAGVVALAGAIRADEPLASAARAADADTKSDGLLVAAWEIISRATERPRSPVELALLRRAARRAPAVIPRRVVPIRRPPRTALAVGALILPVLASLTTPSLDGEVWLAGDDGLSAYGREGPGTSAPDDRSQSEADRAAEASRLSEALESRPETAPDDGSRPGDGGEVSEAEPMLGASDLLDPSAGVTEGRSLDGGLLRATPGGVPGEILLGEARATDRLQDGEEGARTRSDASGDEGGAPDAPSGEDGVQREGAGTSTDESADAAGSQDRRERGSGAADSPAGADGGSDTTPADSDPGSGAGTGTTRNQQDGVETPRAPPQALRAVELPSDSTPAPGTRELLSRAAPTGTDVIERLADGSYDFSGQVARVLERTDIPEAARGYVRDYFLLLQRERNLEVQ